VAPAGFEDIADGSLFAEFHIEDPDIWAQVKDGTFKGFSLEGIFEMRPEQDQRQVDDIVSKTDNFSKRTNMSKINKIKTMLAKMLASLASVTTDKGVLEWDGEEDLKAGDAVFIVNQDGEREAAADGDYITEDGKKIVVADGKVAEIVDQEAEVGSEPEGEEAFGRKATDKGELLWDGEEDLKAGDEVFVVNEGERQPAPDGEYATEDGKVIVVVDGKVAEIKDAEAEVAPAEEPSEEVAELRRQVDALKKELAELKAKPMAQPAHEEVKASSVPGKTGIKGLDRLAAIMSAK
jgi:polyhydroxyalkanoate synthesis regulator phasin